MLKAMHACNPVPRSAADTETAEVVWSTSRFCKRACLKGTRQRVRGKDARGLLLASSNTQAWTRNVYAHTTHMYLPTLTPPKNKERKKVENRFLKTEQMGLAPQLLRLTLGPGCPSEQKDSQFWQATCPRDPAGWRHSDGRADLLLHKI